MFSPSSLLADIRLPAVFAFVLPLALLLPRPASAAEAIPGLFPTGVDDQGRLLADGSVDPHYRLVASADPAAPGPAARVVVSNAFPIPPWLANGPDSKWIAPDSSQAVGNSPGDYVYRLTFSLAGFQPATATINGRWTSDNGGVSIRLNGVDTGQSQGGAFAQFHDFTLSSGFVADQNTLEFIVNNAGDSVNPTGLRVELAGTAERDLPPGIAPTILAHPDDAVAPIGGSAVFTVSATGSPPLTYSWRRNGIPIADAPSSSTFTIPAVGSEDAGTYRVQVSNQWGSVTSAPATLAIEGAGSVDWRRQTYEPPGPSSRRTPLAITEIHYHPVPDESQRDPEFIELHNSNPWPEPVGNFRIEGDWKFTIPAGTMIAAGGYLVLSPRPDDVAAVYGLQGVLGGGAGNLSNEGPSVRLRKPSGAVLIEIDASDDPPWPVSADGGGPSLVLARASLGADDPGAWEASTYVGGSPGVEDPAPSGSGFQLVINEFLANPADGQVEFIEVFNHGAIPVDLSGCRLTDDPASPGFVFADGTTVSAGGFIAVSGGDLGFGLSSEGETILLVSREGDQVFDAVRFGGQDRGIARGRFPDGDERWNELQSVTPGAANSHPLRRPVVINEIFYHPLSGDDGEEFVELHNRSPQSVDVSGWRFTAGIDFAFPAGTSIAPGGFVVVARDRSRLLANHPGLSASAVVGNFGGQLSNRGERLAVAMPVPRSDGSGIYFVEIDEVTYLDGGTWGQWSDGGGSSLELLDPDSDNRLAANWADSDESGKAPWTSIEHTGVLSLGKGTPDQLQVFLMGAGESILDDVEVIPQGGSNRIANGNFSSGANGWFLQGTHRHSAVDGNGGITGAGLRIRAVERGDVAANRIRTVLTTPLANGSTATIRARARWVAGHPEILLRLRGNHLEAVGTLEVPRNLGTPGAVNSRVRQTGVAPPAIDQVLHRPVLPAASEPVRVTARITPTTSAAPTVRLIHRIDPLATLTQTPMRDDGTGADLVANDGIFSAFLPGQSGGTLAAFRIEAADGLATAATATFPRPDHAGPVEALVRWGESGYPGAFGTYRMWMTRDAHTRWANREKLSNEPVSVTFVYGDSRAVYSAGGLYSGSAYTSPGYNTPTGTICGYNIVFPDDERFLGEDEVTLDFPVRDPTAQREQLMYWFCDQFGLPNNHRRYVNVFVNGIGQRQRGGWGPNANVIYEDVQQPGADMIREWFPDAGGGALFKGDYWHEFDDNGNRIDPATANTLEEFLAPEGGKKKARYRWTWRPRATDRTADDFAPLFQLVDTFNTPPDGFTAAVEAAVDIDQWMKTFVVNDLAANWDSFGNPGGKNSFHYLPPGGRWQVMSWDFDVGIGVFNNPVDAALFSISDPRVQRLYSNPTFMRSYWRALDRAVGTFFQASAVAPVLDAKYTAFQASGVPATSPNVPSGESGLSIPAWITQRRAFLVSQLGNVDAAFAITTNGGNSFTTTDTATPIRGTAPVEVAGILLNGAAVPVTWINATSWEITAPLATGANSLTVAGADEAGAPIPGLADTIVVTGITTPDDPRANLVISEIMYHPAPGGAEFVEIANLSTTTAFDIGGWHLDGTGLVFPQGTIIAPSAFLVVTGNRQAFGTTHGWTIPVAAEFPGSLDNGGETLTLVQPAVGDGPETIIDIVRYDDDPPWPGEADGFGASLQAVDLTRDNARLGNWAAAPVEQGPPPIVLPMDAEWRYLQSGFAPAGWTGIAYDDDAWPRGRALLYAESAALPGPKNTPLALGPVSYYFRTRFDYDGSAASPTLDLTTILDDGAVIYLNGEEVHRVRMPAGEPTPFTLATEAVNDAQVEGPIQVPAPSLVAGTNVLAVEVHQSVQNSSDVVWGLEISPGGATLAPSTPGAANSVAARLPDLADLWINEIQRDNATGPVDGSGEREPWIELVNAGAGPLALAGWFLTDDPAVPRKWRFPAGSGLAPGAFAVVWIDGEEAASTVSEWHTGFRMGPAGSTISLVFAPDGTAPAVWDAVVVPADKPDASSGLLPDASPGPVRRFTHATPAAPNSAAIPPPAVVISEWMASNDRFPDPADGDFDDWFELFNASTEPVDLGGFFLTDDLASPMKFSIPRDTVVAPGSHLLVWADEETAQTVPGGDLHVNFRLSAAGESIALFTPTGVLVDAVDFGPQSQGTSEGRWPDGDVDGAVYRQVEPTPGSANRMAPPSPPILPVVEAHVAPDGTIELDFNTEFGRYYQVERSTDLTVAGWQAFGAAIPGFGDPVRVVVTASGASRDFYRILVFDSSPE